MQVTAFKRVKNNAGGHLASLINIGGTSLVWNYLSSGSTAGTYGRSVNDIEQLVDKIKAKVNQL